eukprot:9481168-Pyramimonas_sp.AAC.2
MGVIKSPPPPSEAQKGRLGALLGRSWALLGPSWGLLGPLLGPWPSWGDLEASEARRKRKGENAKNNDFLISFGAILASWGGPWMARLLKPSWAVLGPLGGVIGG